ncbi:fibronectin type III domain-containing protein [Pseudomonadota bacterium]
MSIRKSARVILFSSIFLYGLLPVSLLAGGAPATPGSISASDGAFLDIIRITWADVADETEYQVFRCATIDLATCGDAITTLPADTTQYDDINIFTIGSKNYYRLKSCNSIDCSDFSSADIGYTKLISGNGYEDADVSIRSFTVNGTSQVSLPMPPSGPVILDWSTRSAEYCEASSTPHLDNWNTSVSVSTYGPKSVQLPATANSYSLGLNCHSSPDFELSEYVIVTVGNVPDAPTLNSATADDESVVLAFTPNGDGGAEITAYTAKCGAITQNGNASPITVGGLTNGVEYTCSVFATNVLGNSALSNQKTVTPMTNPQAPTLISATAADSSAVLTFSINDNGGSDITSFTATCGGNNQVGTSSPITVNGLTNGVEVTCSVIATNDVGPSGPSNVKAVTPRTTPDAPTLISATAADSSAVLTFSIDGNGGSDIISFTATCGGNNQPGASSPITVNGLTNGVEVTCSVIATNGVGPSGPSNVKAVTPKTTPDAPTLISATEGDSSALLTNCIACDHRT